MGFVLNKKASQPPTGFEGRKKYRSGKRKAGYKDETFLLKKAVFQKQNTCKLFSRYKND